MADFNYSSVGIVTTSSIAGYSSSLLYQIQSTSEYTQTITDGRSFVDFPGSGNNPIVTGLYTVEVSNVGLSVFSSTTSGIDTSKNYIVQSTSPYVYESVISYIPEPYPYQQLGVFNFATSGIDTSKIYQIQSTSSYTQTITDGRSPINFPGSGTNPIVTGLYTVPVVNVGLSIFSSTNTGYFSDRRPLTGQLYPRNYSSSRANESGIINLVVGLSSGPSGVINKTRSGYLTGNRNPIGQVFPRGVKRQEN